MYGFSYYPYSGYMVRQGDSFIRILHAAPRLPAVDVYANGKLIARNLGYKVFTPYLKVPSGSYSIKVYRTGTSSNPFVASDVALRPGNIYTSAVTGTGPNIELTTIHDTFEPVDPDRANVRFIHLSPDTPAVDVAVAGGRRLFSDISYRGSTGYVPLNPGRYTIQVQNAGAGNVILNVPNVRIRPARNISIYAVGLSAGDPKLQVLIPLDGSTYLRP